MATSVLLGWMMATGGIAFAQPATGSIGPHQHFVGLVNGKSTKATIIVACAGPASIGETGHPVGGKIAVEPPSTVAGTSGYTGSHGDSVVATFVVPVDTSATSSALTFTQYGSRSIPSSLLLPCSGSGAVVFSPEPQSKTAQDVTVSVTYANIAVVPTPAASAKLTSSRAIKVTEADNGRSYRLHKGDVLDVQLAGPSYAVWNEPTSSNQAVLQLTGGSSGATATGAFIAVATGKVEVTASATFKCSSVCAGPSLPVFAVTASVVG